MLLSYCSNMLCFLYACVCLYMAYIRLISTRVRSYSL